jgi:tRNA (adenine-N(1)-)-methyltransferase non-catalytic subunit
MDHPEASDITTAENGNQEVDSSHLIQPGNHILLRLPTNEVRTICIDSPPGDKTVNLGKFGSFRQQCLIGQPFGLTYEVQADKTLVIVPPRRLEELGKLNVL